tara:strand:+ start:7062 stop:7598 length:537 start_codon:yes stop_codon:yes gene_type:complete
MITKKTKFKDLIIFKSKIHQDNRGYFREVFKNKYLNRYRFVFTCVSKSKNKVLRGLHFQNKLIQGKYLTVLKGKILDVSLDLRKNSKTFGKHFKIVLSDKNGKSVFVPPGFAHGFLGLEKENLVIYHCTNYRSKNNENGILWNDKDLKINWPNKKPKMSLKDKKLQTYKSFLKKIKYL